MGERENFRRVHEWNRTLSWRVESGKEVHKGGDTRNSGSAVDNVGLDEVAETGGCVYG